MLLLSHSLGQVSHQQHPHEGNMNILDDLSVNQFGFSVAEKEKKRSDMRMRTTKAVPSEGS